MEYIVGMGTNGFALSGPIFKLIAPILCQFMVTEK